MKTYKVINKVGDEVMNFLTLKEAEITLQELELQDIQDGIFIKDFYKIIENEVKDRLMKKVNFKNLGFIKSYLSGKKILVFNESITAIREDLNLYDCDLSEIDFRNIESIKGDLILSRNNLTSINFKKVKSLGDVYLGNNKISSIDFKNLKSIGVLDLYNNQLTDIDLKSITKICDLNLSNNKLYSIDFRNIKSIGVLYLGYNE